MSKPTTKQQLLDALQGWMIDHGHRCRICMERSQAAIKAANDEGFTPLESKLLTLLDLIEVQEDSTLASQRFAIAEEFGYTVEITGERTSGAIN